MTQRDTQKLKIGDKVFNKHYRKTETVKGITQRPPNADPRIKYPLIVTESGEISYRLLSPVQK